MVKNENNNFYDTVYQVDEYQSVFLKVPAENFWDFRVWHQKTFGFGIKTWLALQLSFASSFF